MKFVDSVIKYYVRDQWVNYRACLNDSQAREKLLGGGLLYLYEVGSTTPKYAFMDEDCSIPHPNPIVATCRGEFPKMFFDGKYSVTLKTADGEDIARADNWTGE